MINFIFLTVIVLAVVICCYCFRKHRENFNAIISIVLVEVVLPVYFIIIAEHLFVKILVGLSYCLCFVVTVVIFLETNQRKKI